MDIIHNALGYYATRDWKAIIGPFPTEHMAIEALGEPGLFDAGIAFHGRDPRLCQFCFEDSGANPENGIWYTSNTVQLKCHKCGMDNTWPDEMTKEQAAEELAHRLSDRGMLRR